MGSPKETGFFNGLFIFFFLFLFNVGGKKKMKPIKIQVSFESCPTGYPPSTFFQFIRELPQAYINVTPEELERCGWWWRSEGMALLNLLSFSWPLPNTVNEREANDEIDFSRASPTSPSAYIFFGRR